MPADPASPSSPVVPLTETTFFGATISATIGDTPHTWTADSSGLFHTSTDLALEWKGYYDTMTAGHADTLTFVQRLEGNSQAVFLNTALNTLDAATQARDREDVQRELDTIAAAMTKLGLDPKAPLTTQQYLLVEQAIQSSPAWEELAMQGHGLNSPSVCKYDGYTNDFQNGVDGSTLYVGPGLDSNENALTAFMDDVVLSHTAFPTVARDDQLVQLNQNGDAEDTLADATGALDAAGSRLVLTAADFSTSPGSASATPFAPPSVTVTPTARQMVSLTGFLVPKTLTVDGHVWIAGSDGLYVTRANLAQEWRTAYRTMLAGNGATLSAARFLEGNAEAVFENTGLAALATRDATQLAYDRMDVQREIDAIVGAATAAGLDPNQPLTVTMWLQLEHALQDNPALQELAIQGHGLNNSSDPRYDGYTNDFQNNVDQKTLYVGAGHDSGERALAELFDDSILTHAPFPTIARNGEIEQLNQNGDDESTVQAQVDEYNQFRFGQVLTASDFNIPGNPVGAQAPGTATTVFGATIDGSITVNGNDWTAGTDGRYHTTTILRSEWEGYYQTMLAGNGASLTAIQRLEGNAEAVFDNTGLSDLKRYNAAKQQSFREDAAREFDAIGAAMAQLNLGGALLNAQDYLAIGRTIQANATWEELALQGHGLNNPPSRKYGGYTEDFQNNSDNSTYFVGGGVDNGEKAIAAFFDDVILSHLAFPVVSQNGVLEQLNQNGDSEDTLATAVQATNEAMFTRVFVASDFSSKPKATGDVVWVSPAMATAQPAGAATPGAGQMLSLFGDVIPTTLVVNGDTWVADANGRYVTATDLTLQWWNSYQAALAGQPLTLTQQWQAQAEVVFLNTGLSELSEGQQAIDRMDAEREIDAVVQVMTQLGLGAGPLTTADYLAVQHALQGNAALEQLAIEGHGLNNPWRAGATEYLGYTNDFQYSVDNRTLYVGPGPDNGERALTEFFDDDIMTHLPFPTIVQNGELTQLNQNGNAESTLNEAVQQMNATLFGPLLSAANFLVPGRQTPPAESSTTPATITGYYGDTLPGTVTLGGHTWTADADGVYQTAANLEMEWRAAYQTMLAGRGDALTATQRLEANLEAFLENSSINTMWNGAAREEQMRVDLQRVVDAIDGALQIDQRRYGFDPAKKLSEASFLQLGNTLRGNAQLEELALQGFGMAQPPSAAYRGAYDAIFAGADWSTRFVGGGSDNGKLAIVSVLPDMLGNLPFQTTYINGVWTTTGTSGQPGETALTAAGLMNQAMYRQVFTSADFARSATATGAIVLIPGAATATVTPVTAVQPGNGKVVTLSGARIAATMTVDGHVWTADSTGLFHTASLAAEWQAAYAAMLAGKGDTLSAIQRAEGNAEAVLEATGVSKLASAQAVREDVQRQLDAEAAAMPALAKLGSTPLDATGYLALARTLQASNALEELALQGHGVTGAASARYRGLLGDVAGLSGIRYVGGGLNNGSYALGAFLQQNIVGDLPFAVVRQYGTLMQYDQSGRPVLNVGDAVAALDDTLWYRTYTRAAFAR
ncbi:MAG: hypothetical protein U1E23_15370 [Reyranellaceae bacterium]